MPGSEQLSPGLPVQANLLSEPLSEPSGPSHQVSFSEGAQSSSLASRKGSQNPLPKRQLSEWNLQPNRPSLLSGSLDRLFHSNDSRLSDEQGQYTRVSSIGDHEDFHENRQDRKDGAEQTAPRARKLFTESFEFHAISVVVLLLNTGVIGCEAAFITNEGLKSTFTFIEATFTLLYVIEVGWRIWENGWHFFIGYHMYWNWFDLIVTITGVLDCLISCLSVDENVNAFGKFFRMFRILRLFRAIRFLSEIDYVLATASKATLKLCALVSFVVFVAAIITTHLLWDSEDPEVQTMFGNLGASMWSVFKLMTLDGWVSIADSVLKERPGMIIFFVLFVFCASIALMSLVPAIFIELNMATREKEERRQKEAYEQSLREKRTRVLHRLFTLTDTDGSGEVSQAELEVALSNTQIIDQLKSAGLLEEGDLRDVKLGLCDMFEEQIEEHGNEDVELNLNTFISGFLKVKEATNSQVWRSVTATRVDFRNLVRATTSGFQEMQAEVRDLRADVNKFETRGLYELMHSVLDEVRGIRETLHGRDKVVDKLLQNERSVVDEVRSIRETLQQRDKVVEALQQKVDDLHTAKVDLEAKLVWSRQSCEEAQSQARLAGIRNAHIQMELDASKAEVLQASEADCKMTNAEQELCRSEDLVAQLRSSESALEQKVRDLQGAKQACALEEQVRQLEEENLQTTETLRIASLNLQASERERRRLQRQITVSLNDSRTASSNLASGTSEQRHPERRNIGTADDAAGGGAESAAAAPRDLQK